jgi:hypothetical protein
MSTSISLSDVLKDLKDEYLSIVDQLKQIGLTSEDTVGLIQRQDEILKIIGQHIIYDT